MMMKTSAGVIAFRYSYIDQSLAGLLAVHPNASDQIAESLICIFSPMGKIRIPIR